MTTPRTADGIHRVDGTTTTSINANSSGPLRAAFSQAAERPLLPPVRCAHIVRTLQGIALLDRSGARLSTIRAWRTRLATATLTTSIAVAALGAPTPAMADSGRIADTALDPTTASIQMSQSVFADDSSPYVVLGRNDVFADNLAGAALTNGTGPLLLVDAAPNVLADDVRTEIERVLPPSGDCASQPTNVYILGGDNAVDPSVEIELNDRGYCVERLAGPSRVETSVAVAQAMLQKIFDAQDDPSTGTRGPILIARDDNAADSATAGALGAAAFIPIVVTNSQSLHPAVAELLQPGDTAWSAVTLLGGTAALSDDVQDQVVDAATGQGTFDVPVDRIAGSSRDDTAFRIASELWPAFGFNPEVAMIVNGFNGDDFWQYALPAGAVGGNVFAPMLYVSQDTIPSTTDTYLRQTPLTSLITVGSVDQISDAVKQQAEGSLGSGTTPDNQRAG